MLVIAMLAAAHAQGQATVPGQFRYRYRSGRNPPTCFSSGENRAAVHRHAELSHFKLYCYNQAAWFNLSC